MKRRLQDKKQGKKKKQRKILLGIGLLLLLLLGIVVWIVWNLRESKEGLTVSYYEIEAAELTETIRVVQLSDLHNQEFRLEQPGMDSEGLEAEAEQKGLDLESSEVGCENERLIQLVAEQSPDLILLTGDLLNAEEETTEIAGNLVRRLCAIAPVYASYGNHEKEHEQNYGVDLTAYFQEAGAHVLEYSWEDVTVKGQKLRLGGLYGYCMPAKYLQTGEADAEECAFLEAFQGTDLYTILLCHMPFCWLAIEGLEEWDVDCVFAGHDHGGQIRLPFLGGFYAPDQGFFPGRECGVYENADASCHLVLSRGLGSNGKIPRFSNVPEVVVTDFVPKAVERAGLIGFKR